MKLFSVCFLYLLSRAAAAGLFVGLLSALPGQVRAEAMLQLFNVSWSDLTKKMPELAEAGYDSIWLPPPAKSSSVYSIGYDVFDPYDLGDVNQTGTTATHWGTKAELLELVQTAHRFGVRIYFDNIMNHRGFTVPGYNASTPTNFYPGLIPQDFHLQTTGGTYVNWPSVQDYSVQWDVQYQSLGGLIDLATEPGPVNGNFGATSGSTIPKPNFLRQPGQRQYYMDASKPAIEGSPWHPFNGTNGVPVAEDVNSYLIRAALYTLSETKCDGFRLDAVKHVPSGFFGNSSAGFSGYCGAIQAMFDYVHGYGSNTLSNGYLEGDDSRNSLFNTEAPRNDALLFGEHLGEPPSFGEYITSGMRLLNAPLRDQMNNALNGNASLAGMDQRDYGAISPVQSVMFAQNHDASGSYAAHRELQNAYYFMHEGMAVIYSDGYNQSGAPNYFPAVAYANYLGEYGDNQMPEVCYLHNQLARGGTSPRWSSYNLVAFERYDYRESSIPADETVVLFVMNDKTSYPGDITFDDGISQATNNDYYGNISVSNSQGQGLAVGFPPGSVLVQLASSSPTGGRAYQKLLVHAATASAAAASASINAADPTQRLIYVGGQTIPPGGGAIELNVPSGSWVMYGYQWPEASRANPVTNAIVLRQGGSEVPRFTVYRMDGANGDAGFNPAYPFKMRGSVDPLGNLIAGNNVSNRTYAIDVPVVTNANFDIIVRSDASCANTLVKLDGGVDLNSQMLLGPTSGGVGPNGYDLRDNKPGYATDMFLGYEQTALQFRNGPEKFAARSGLSNNIISLGAETYSYTVGGASNLVSGTGYGAHITNQTASAVLHDPLAANTALTPNNSATQRVPLSPGAGATVDVYAKVYYQFQINTCHLYYTTDGSNPEGAYGTGKGTTKVVQAFWVNHDSAQSNIDWWKGTIPAQPAGTQVRYKLALFYGGSVYAGQDIPPISDGEPSGAKLYGLTQAAITNFNPQNAVVWLHNDLNTNSTTIGLKPGFHIVRAKTFLPRTNQSSVFNTFLQTFYYAGPLAAGVIPYPANGGTVASSSYTVVIRAESTVTGVDFNIQDSNPGNDDSVTGKANGNGNSNGAPVFVAATPVTPNPALSAQYPNYPLEFRWVYTNVPSSGTAAISVRLKDFASVVYPNRFTLITNTVATLAPAQVVAIARPASDGAVITYATNSTYQVEACFTATLTTAKTNFNVLINGELQSQGDYTLRPNGSCPDMKSLYYNWKISAPGTNLIQVIYTNASPPISDTRVVIVAPPLKITGLANNNQLVVWDSAPGINYQVLATTNLIYPFQLISDLIPGAGASTYFYDATPASQKFYRIQLVP